MDLKLAVAFALSPYHNPRHLECYWYPVYKALFRPLESLGSYNSSLAPQFTVSRSIREETEDTNYFPQQSESTDRHIPTAIRRYNPETNETTLEEIPTFPTPPQETEQETTIKEYREWRIHDFVLVVSQYPRAEILLTAVSENVKVEIASPVLSRKEVIIPVIIEVKGQHSNHPFDISRRLMKAEKQLLQQAGFLFSDFDWLQEVIAIAGVGLYWWWFKIPRPPAAPRGQGPDDDYEFQGHPSSDSNSSDISTSLPPIVDLPSNTSVHVDHPPNQAPPPIAHRTPFVIGTEESAREVSKVKAMVQKMAKQGLGTVHVPEDAEERPNNDTADYYGFLRMFGREGIPNKREREYRWEIVEDGREDDQEESDGPGGGSSDADMGVDASSNEDDEFEEDIEM